MNSSCDGFRDGVSCMGLFSALPNLDDPRFILDELAYSLPAQPPSFCELADSVVLLSEAAGVVGNRAIDNSPEMKHVFHWVAVERCAHNRLFSECRSSNVKSR